MKETVRRLLTDTDWTRLSHAYGPADDTFFHLANLISAEDGERVQAMEHLWMAVLHQGTVVSATGPAARVVAALLPDTRLLQLLPTMFGRPRDRSMRAELLHYLGFVAYAAQYDGSHDDPAQTLSTADRQEPLDTAILACRELAPELTTAVRPWLDAAEPGVAEAACHAWVRLTQLERATAGQTVNWLSAQAADTSLPAATRAERVLALRELGAPTQRWLDDPDQVVRACAALSSPAADDRATGELLAFLEALPESDEWLLGSHFLDGWPRFTFLAAVNDRVAGFDRMLPAAVRVAAVAYASSFTDDWGLLLAKAFPPARQAGPLTSAQAAYVNALCDNDRIWDGLATHGPAARMFAERGLPLDRRRLHRLVLPWHQRMLGRLGDIYWRAMT